MSNTIQNLQTALGMELTALHQYQLHASVLDDWGLIKLANKMREEMQEEIEHSNEYISRILFLKNCCPQLILAKQPVLVNNLVEMFKIDLADEKEAIKFYTQAAKEAMEEDDIGTRVLFEKIVMDEEKHMSWLELQLELIERVGETNYMTKQI